MLLSNNNKTSKLSIEDAKFGCKVQLWVCSRGSKQGRFFCSNHLCGVQTGLAPLLCLLSSGLLSVLKRNMSYYEKGQGETTGQWSPKASHHFSLWSINNPCVHVVSGLQESSSLASITQMDKWQYPGYKIKLCLQHHLLILLSFCLHLGFESEHYFNFFFSFTTL